ncbi:MAG TPA: multidrug resistance efflux transporter family protein [Savagea sp.]
MKPFIYGVAAAFFFAVTFIANAWMDETGGHWTWSASLRFFWMVPLLYVLVRWRTGVERVHASLRERPLVWLVWSTVGFGLFYAPLTFAAGYAPGWLVASTWQLTILAGLFVAPFVDRTVRADGTVVRGTIAWRSVGWSTVIVVGVVLLQWSYASDVSFAVLCASVLPVAFAAFAYPLGNRMMMRETGETLSALERVYGMTCMSLPFWFVIALYGAAVAGGPSAGQWSQTFVVALSSGVLATVLFFHATSLVRHDASKLGAVEATQSLEVVFALGGEMVVLGAAAPTGLGMVGLVVLLCGMLAHRMMSTTERTRRNEA